MVWVDNCADKAKKAMSTTPSTKLHILALLRESRDWLSGEAVSERLGISRAAVAKHIASLRAEGYLIEAVSRRGYVLKMEPDSVEAGLLKKSLNTKIIGHGQWVWREKTSSTNNEAAALGAAGAPDGSLALADLQTQGRGRRGRKWFSPPRSIQFSVLLRPNLPAQRLSTLSLLACLVVQKTFAELTGAEFIIKWPNDILVNHKKVAAVLVEASIIGGEIEWAVLGIGCNLNAVSAEFPQELREVITSVYEATGRQLARNAVYEKLLTELDNYYTALLKHGPAPLIAEWLQKTDIVGKTLSLAAGGQTVSGQVTGLTADGLLVVRDRAGREHHIEVGDYPAA